MNDDDIYTVDITVFIRQDDFTLCESANETLSNAKTEQVMSQMGQDEEDFNIKECITFVVVLFTLNFWRKIVVVCVCVSVCASVV